MVSYEEVGREEVRAFCGNEMKKKNMSICVCSFIESRNKKFHSSTRDFDLTITISGI